MKPIDICIVAVIAVILVGIAVYLIRAKKKGAKCIGCPDSHHCTGNCAGCGKD